MLGFNLQRLLFEEFVMFGQKLRKIDLWKSGKPSAPILSITKVLSYDDYIHHVNRNRQSILDYFSFEKSLIANASKKFIYNGYCYVCRGFVDFFVDFNYAYEVEGVLMPNWRERLVCPICHLNNRMRAVVHVFNLECLPNKSSNIYITEQTTPLYKLIKKTFSNTYGSEYLGDSVNYGKHNSNGIRNEDLTKLTFTSNQFNYILSFDVFEHIPNYKKALAECYRCIKPGGIFFFTVPFARASKENIVRAHLSPTGEITHLLTPEYHGDPLNPDGCLCFRHFGWEILEDLRAVGFKNSQAFIYWSKEFGYLGGEQLIFAARKE